MARFVLALCFVLASLTALGCGGGRGSAPKAPDGTALGILVYTDRGITPDMPPERVTQINQLASWMEDDLLTMLSNSGYAATRVADPATQPGPNRYVLRVAIKNYSAGSKAARMFVGFGAGAAVLDTHFELIGDGGAALLAGDPSVGSGRDWRHSARKVNEQTVNSVTARLRQR